MPAVSHADDFRWNAKIHAVKKPLLAGREYKARCNLDLATLVPELVPDTPESFYRKTTKETFLFLAQPMT